ncbi:MAG: tetratricopeptide repeat protein [Chloroflexi bacterium]|nr:tetratricopeptide repeat protein [Chloroflexota bacterium]
MTMRATARTVQAPLDRPDGIGARMRQLREQAGLTQQQLAEGRYTRAYVSSLENSLTRPSMAALTFFAERLDVPVSRFLPEEVGRWGRLEADIRLAAGEWREAADAYGALLTSASDPATRAELLLGRSEALCRMERAETAVSPAAEAAALFQKLGRRADAAKATYWLAGAQYARENSREARDLLQALLTETRSGLRVEPAFELRLLVALATIDSRDGEHRGALGYLEEARALASELDDRQRASFLFSLALSYRETGDIEAAIRTGSQSLLLYSAAGEDLETASIQNDLALAYLALGNHARARQLTREARKRVDTLRDKRSLAHLTETEAQIALADGSNDEALRLAHEAVRLARLSGNEKAEISGLLTHARAHVAEGRLRLAAATLETAAALARRSGKRGRMREALQEWAAVLACCGEHAQAYELVVEALELERD